MSLLVVGLSHRSAPVEVLEACALGREGVDKLLADLSLGSQVAEAAVIATCNRLEVYADVASFHGGVQEIGDLVARHTGQGPELLTPHLYVHYEDRAVTHLFRVASGLDSMVVGESQILGQVRDAFRGAQGAATAGRVLGELFPTALRVGKRAHAETGIDAAGRSMVTVGLAAAAPEGVEGSSVLVVGAGSMAALAVTTLTRMGADVVVASRTLERAERLAETVGATAVPVSQVTDPELSPLRSVQLVVSCTGALAPVLTVDDVAAVLPARDGAALAILDLALPRDVESEVGELPGVGLVGLSDLARRSDVGADDGVLAAVAAVTTVVEDGAEEYSLSRRRASVAPTVVALRRMAAEVVEAEMQRLDGRLDVDAGTRAEIGQTVHRVVEKLLHAPTVRVKELAVGPDGASYENALRELFSLDPRAVDAVTRPPQSTGPEQRPAGGPR